MGKLHEVLAVEGARKGAFEKIRGETIRVFKERADLFSGFERRYEPFAEEDAREKGVVEQQAITTTVNQRLEYLGGFLAEMVDTVFQKERTNTKAHADVALGDGPNAFVIEGAPVSFLLNLESTLGGLREVMNNIPTHQSGINWVPDPDHELKPHVVRSKEPEMVFRTKKVIKPFELAPATKEHKAQVEKLTEDKPVGKIFRDLWSAMLTPAQKSEIMERLDKLIERVRVARMQANQEEVMAEHVGEQLVKYLLNGQ